MKLFNTFIRKIIFIIWITGSIDSFAQDARLQIIHNSSDPVLTTADLYIGDSKIADDVQYRGATPFTNVQSGVPLTIGIAPGNSTSSADVIKSFTHTFVTTTKTIAMISGVRGTGYSANPNGRNIELKFHSNFAAKEFANDPATVELDYVHGSTDLDIVKLTVGETVLANNVGYGDYAGYQVFTPQEYTFKLTHYSGSPLYGTYNGDLTGLAGKAIVLFSTGFLTPGNNKNGPSSDLYYALPTGETGPVNNMIASANSGKEFSDLNAFPVPAIENILNIEVSSKVADRAVISYFNLFGQKVRSDDTIFLEAGKNSFSVDIGNLKNGEYYINIITSLKSGTLRFSKIN